MKRSVVLIICLIVISSLSCSGNHTSDKPSNKGNNQVSDNMVKRIQDTTKSQQQDKGAGPISSVELGPVNQQLANKGQNIFQQNCSGCHAMNQRKVGPALGDVTQEQTPEFIMNMILNPSGMIQNNSQVQAMVKEYGVTMPDVGLDSTQARAVLRISANSSSREPINTQKAKDLSFKITLFLLASFVLCTGQCPVPPVFPSPAEISVNVYSNPGETELSISGFYQKPSLMLNPGLEYSFANWISLEIATIFNVKKPHAPLVQLETALSLWADTCKRKLLGSSVEITLPIEHLRSTSIETVIGFAFGFTRSLFLVSEVNFEILSTFNQPEAEFSVASGPYFQGSKLFAGIPLRYLNESGLKWGVDTGFDFTDDLAIDILVTTPFKIEPDHIIIFAGVKFEILEGRRE